MYVLYIQPLSDDSRTLYTTAVAEYLKKPYHERDAGLDLYVAEDHQIGKESRLVGQGVIAGLYDTDRKLFRAYWMLPRSSISKTNLRLANSVGLIDAGYRGEIKAALYAIKTTQTLEVISADKSVFFEYDVITQNTRIVQLATPDLLPFDDIKIVDEIPGGVTLRGEGGFGSTGK